MLKQGSLLVEGKDYFSMVKERIAYYGVDEASPQDLLTFLLGKNVSADVVKEIATLSTHELIQMSAEDYKSIGLSKANAEKMVAVIALGNQLFKQRNSSTTRIKSPECAAKMLDWMRFEKQEQLVALYLNAKNEVIMQKTLFKGTLNASILHPREVFKYGLKCSCASVLLAHNHPSGEPTQSPEDIEVTKRIAEAGAIIGIDLLDHIIVAEYGFTSLKEKGLF